MGREEESDEEDEAEPNISFMEPMVMTMEFEETQQQPEWGG